MSVESFILRIHSSRRMRCLCTKFFIISTLTIGFNNTPAITIGMLPPLPLSRFKQVGNAAGTGACLALISLSQRLEAERIAGRDRYIELAGIPEFNRKFAEASSMTNDRLF